MSQEMPSKLVSINYRPKLYKPVWWPSFYEAFLGKSYDSEVLSGEVVRIGYNSRHKDGSFNRDYYMHCGANDWLKFGRAIDLLGQEFLTKSRISYGVYGRLLGIPGPQDKLLLLHKKSESDILLFPFVNNYWLGRLEVPLSDEGQWTQEL